MTCPLSTLTTSTPFCTGLFFALVNPKARAIFLPSGDQATLLTAPRGANVLAVCQLAVLHIRTRSGCSTEPVARYLPSGDQSKLVTKPDGRSSVLRVEPAEGLHILTV